MFSHKASKKFMRIEPGSIFWDLDFAYYIQCFVPWSSESGSIGWFVSFSSISLTFCASVLRAHMCMLSSTDRKDTSCAQKLFCTYSRGHNGGKQSFGFWYRTKKYQNILGREVAGSSDKRSNLAFNKAPTKAPCIFLPTPHISFVKV